MNKKTTKLTKKEGWYIFSIIMLTLSFFVVLLVFLNNPLSHPINEQLGQRQLGEDIIINIESCGSFVNTVNFKGDLLPNFVMEQNCFLRLKNNQNNCVMRAKIFMYDNNEKLINISSNFTSDWEENSDGYYYYKRVLEENVVQKFMNSVEIPSADAKLSSQAFYTIIISIETLPETSNYTSLWGINSL